MKIVKGIYIMKTIKKLEVKIAELKDFIKTETDLDVKIHAESYPLSIEFYDAQIGMFDEDKPEDTPTLRFVFSEDMKITTEENFTVGEKVFNKLKSLSKEINRLYLNAFREELDGVIGAFWDTKDGKSVKAQFDLLMGVDMA